MRLSSTQTKEESSYVRSQTSIGVAVVPEMDYHQELREQNHVYQVRTHCPARKEKSN